MSQQSPRHLKLLQFECPERMEKMAAVSGGFHCDRCQKKVHDLSRLSPTEAREVYQKRNADLCVSYLRRDSRILFRKRSGALVALSVAAWLSGCDGEWLSRAEEVEDQRMAGGLGQDAKSHLRIGDDATTEEQKMTLGKAIRPSDQLIVRTKGRPPAPQPEEPDGHSMGEENDRSPGEPRNSNRAPAPSTKRSSPSIS